VPSAARQEIFQSNPTEGSLRRANGERVAAFSNQFVQTLHVSLLEQFAENAQDVLYRCGYEWGLLASVRLQRELLAQLGPQTDLWKLEPKYVLETWWAPLAETGWGRCGFDVPSAQGVVVAELHESAVVSALGGSDQPVCHLYAGLLAAALSFVARAERHAVELQCRALGAPSCQFVIAPGAQVDSAETWRQQGLPALEIVRRLR